MVTGKPAGGRSVEASPSHSNFMELDLHTPRRPSCLDDSLASTVDRHDGLGQSSPSDHSCLDLRKAALLRSHMRRTEVRNLRIWQPENMRCLYVVLPCTAPCHPTHLHAGMGPPRAVCWQVCRGSRIGLAAEHAAPRFASHLGALKTRLLLPSLPSHGVTIRRVHDVHHAPHAGID